MNDRETIVALYAAINEIPGNNDDAASPERALQRIRDYMQEHADVMGELDELQARVDDLTDGDDERLTTLASQPHTVAFAEALNERGGLVSLQRYIADNHLLCGPSWPTEEECADVLGELTR